MKNRLSDLTNHLFEQMERLNDEDLSGEGLDRELERAKGMGLIASQIIQAGELAYKTMRHLDECGRGETKVPELLDSRSGS